MPKQTSNVKRSESSASECEDRSSCERWLLLEGLLENLPLLYKTTSTFLDTLQLLKIVYCQYFLQTKLKQACMSGDYFLCIIVKHCIGVCFSSCFFFFWGLRSIVGVGVVINICCVVYTLLRRKKQLGQLCHFISHCLLSSTLKATAFLLANSLPEETRTSIR